MRVNNCPIIKDYVCRNTGLYCDKSECLIKDMALNMYRVALDGQCDRCDGCGWDGEEGCQAKTCGNWAAYEFLDKLDVEPQDGDWEKTGDPYIEEHQL